ncbi:MAG: ribonuclease HI [Bacillota bacterium]|nr:ribonuclease HI [Bacillota bacterium]
MPKKQVTMYTDGACSGNPGPGGFGVILQYNGYEKRLSGGFFHTTNNRMELLAVIEGLKLLKESCAVNLYTDSKYIADALQKRWVYGWRDKGWRKSDGKSVLNIDLWQMLLKLLEIHEVSINWVKGHADNQFNNACDQMAVSASRQPTQKDSGFEI